eukprot:s2127_g5.t1
MYDLEADYESDGDEEVEIDEASGFSAEGAKAGKRKEISKMDKYCLRDLKRGKKRDDVFALASSQATARVIDTIGVKKGYMCTSCAVQSLVDWAAETVNKDEQEIEALDEQKAFEYRSCVGKALYLSFDRPDCQHAVRVLTKFMKEPTAGVMNALSRFARYLSRSRDEEFSWWEAAWQSSMMFNGRDGNQGIFYKEIFAGAPAAADLAGQQRCSRRKATYAFFEVLMKLGAAVVATDLPELLPHMEYNLQLNDEGGSALGRWAVDSLNWDSAEARDKLRAKLGDNGADAIFATNCVYGRDTVHMFLSTMFALSGPRTLALMCGVPVPPAAREVSILDEFLAACPRFFDCYLLKVPGGVENAGVAREQDSPLAAELGKPYGLSAAALADGVWLFKLPGSDYPSWARPVLCLGYGTALQANVWQRKFDVPGFVAKYPGAVPRGAEAAPAPKKRKAKSKAKGATG